MGCFGSSEGCPRWPFSPLTSHLLPPLVLDTTLTVRSMVRAHEAVADGADADRIGHRLGVAYSVDGSVQRGAGHLPINLRLVRSSDTMAMWAGNFEEAEGNLAGLSQRVAASAVAGIVARLSAPLAGVHVLGSNPRGVAMADTVRTFPISREEFGDKHRR
jgi:hypothetical protein